MRFCKVDMLMETLSETLAPRAESSRARLMYKAFASGRTGMSPVRALMGVGVIGSKGESSGVAEASSRPCVRYGEGKEWEVREVERRGEAVRSLPPPSGRLMCWRVTKEVGGGKMNFCGSALMLREELGERRRRKSEAHAMSAEI